MHVSVTTAQVSTDRVDELGPLYERFLPTLRAARGWRGVYLAVERATGEGYVIGLWDDEADAQEFERSGAFQRLLADYPPGLIVRPPQRRVAEVVFRASADGVG